MKPSQNPYKILAKPCERNDDCNDEEHYSTSLHITPHYVLIYPQHPFQPLALPLLSNPHSQAVFAPGIAGCRTDNQRQGLTLVHLSH